MTIPQLLAMADGLQPIPTEKVNVRVTCSECGASEEPLMRRLTRVVRQEILGSTWLYWYWTPESTGPVKGTDCGYSGRRVSVLALTQARVV